MSETRCYTNKLNHARIVYIVFIAAVPLYIVIGIAGGSRETVALDNLVISAVAIALAIVSILSLGVAYYLPSLARKAR